MSREDATYLARIARAKANLKQFTKDLTLAHIEVVPVLAGDLPTLDGQERMHATIFFPSMRKSVKQCDIKMPSVPLPKTHAERVSVDGIEFSWHAAVKAVMKALT